jgi:hypothetical protein
VCACEKARIHTLKHTHTQPIEVVFDHPARSAELLETAAAREVQSLQDIRASSARTIGLLGLLQLLGY